MNWTTIILGGAIGLVVGTVAGYVGKCRSGACPITSTPQMGALVGAVLGVLIAMAFAKGAGVTATGSTADFDAKVLKAPRPVVVDFYADWCGPCRQLAPTIEALAGEYAGRVDFMKVDVDKLGELAQRYGVQAIPNVVLFRDGQVAHRWIGLKPAEEYRKVLDDLLAPAPAPPPKPIIIPTKEPAMTQPTTSVTMKGAPIKLSGPLPAVGATAPDFVAVDTNLAEASLGDYRGKVVVLLTVPSLDTPVCSREARRFNEAAAGLGKDVVVLAVSMDLPFAQKRWCGAEGIEAVRTLSDHRTAAFGRAYGVLMPDLRLLARAVFVVGKDGKIAYEQLVPEVASEPDYDAALAAATSAAKA